jgi:hypothetical protein
MKSQLNWNHQTLQSLTAQPTQKRSLLTKLSDFWQKIFADLSASAEPHVWQTQDSTGKTGWNAYDPMTKRSIEQVSAPELRAWLEERHYQRGWAA